MLALNPHAGDDGLLGQEEQDIIAPAVKELSEKGIYAFGPFAADGFSVEAVTIHSTVCWPCIMTKDLRLSRLLTVETV